MSNRFAFTTAEMAAERRWHQDTLPVRPLRSQDAALRELGLGANGHLALKAFTDALMYRGEMTPSQIEARIIAAERSMRGKDWQKTSVLRASVKKGIELAQLHESNAYKNGVENSENGRNN